MSDGAQGDELSLSVRIAELEIKVKELAEIVAWSIDDQQFHSLRRGYALRAARRIACIQPEGEL